MIRQFTFQDWNKIDTAQYLAYAVSVFRIAPWVTCSSVKDAAPWLSSSARAALDNYLSQGPLCQTALEEAAKILSWGQYELARSSEHLSKYELALGRATLLDHIDQAETKLVASLVPYYYIARIAARSHKAMIVPKQRYDLGPLGLLGAVSLAFPCQTRNRYIFLDHEQRAFLWQTTRCLEQGRAYVGRGTVRGVRRICRGLVTILSHCRLIQSSKDHLTTTGDPDRIGAVTANYQ